MRRSGTPLALVLLLSAAPAPAADEGPCTTRLGQQIDNITLTDQSGKAVPLEELKGKRATVVIFLSPNCPMCTAYTRPLAELATAYAGRGVAILGILDGAEDAQQAAEFVRDYEISFPVLRDCRQRAAAAFAARVTPEAFVLDAGRVLRYRGRIDDGYAERLKKKPRVARHDLRQALDDLLAGRDVTTAATQALGCPIRTEAVAKGARAVAVTYYRDVLPVLQKHCQECHRPGEVGPFALMTYRQAVHWAPDIKEYTRTRKMPPWKPSAGGPFHGERKLSEREIATLAAWADGGTPEGDPKDAPPPRRFTQGWQLGRPDVVLTVPDDFHLGATGPDLYRYFVLPTNFPGDKYLSAVEVRPGNRRVVHHAIMLIDGAGRARRLEENAQKRAKRFPGEDHGPGYSVSPAVAFFPGFLPDGGIGGWSPGMVLRHLPEEAGNFLPKGADIVLQVHYHRSGRAERDRTQLGLYYCRKPVKGRMQGLSVPAQFLRVPAGDGRYRVTGSIRVRQKCRLIEIMPHMHMLGHHIRVHMTRPGEPKRTLVAIDDWDFNWQENYYFKEPIDVSEGTRFDVEGVFDNSAANPNNPNRPPRTVFAGLATSNEMCVGFLGVVADRPGAVRYDVLLTTPVLGKLPIPAWGI
jgi:peroxiredoxin